MTTSFRDFKILSKKAADAVMTSRGRHYTTDVRDAASKRLLTNQSNDETVTITKLSTWREIKKDYQYDVCVVKKRLIFAIIITKQ